MSKRDRKRGMRMDTDQQSQSPPQQPYESVTPGDPGTATIHRVGLPFFHEAHEYLARRRGEGPVKVADQLDRRNPVTRLNSRLALGITIGVGSMWCAYLFALLAFVSFPSAIGTGNTIIIVAWIAQTFLQLVLLPVIIVGQNLRAAASDKRAQQTYNDAEAILHEAMQIQKHLLAQDAHLMNQDQRLQDIITQLEKAYPATAGS